ncbi:MAG: hypothetical protein DRI44_00015 [Chlamydiae bacterium]|nr:MAG: hypothetical protein DRI44_00015 [Chlamydiota bacterium]
MKTIILLLSIMMITSISVAKRSGNGSGHRNRYNSEQKNCNGDSLRKQERKRHRKNMTPEEIKKREERIQKRIRHMAKGDEAEFNRLMKLRKDDPEAFRAEMQARRVQRNKNKKLRNKRVKGGNIR